jgi:threonine dehydrogenase-like Zn-dependent dehydrogenase
VKTLHARSLGVLAPGHPWIFEALLPPLDDGQILVATRYTGLSAGTELSVVKGTNPHHRRRWDRDHCVFVDGAPRSEYPVRVLGYMEVARVVCSRSASAAVGTELAMTYGHRTAHVADPTAETAIPLPDDLDPLLGVFVGQMGPICANGLLHAAAEAEGPDTDDLGAGVRGRHVLVTGAGVVGLLTGLFARHYGATAVAVADPTPVRLAAAEGLGLEPIDTAQVEPWRWCKQRWRHGSGDCGADVAFQCRGRSAALTVALRALRPQGTVVDLAFYQDAAADLCLGEEFHHNGLAIRCAQIARVPRGLAGRWDRRRLAAETVTLLRAHGVFVRRHLVTDVVPFDDGPAFLAEVAARRRHTLQAVFVIS